MPLTAAMYSTATFRSASHDPAPNGMTASTSSVGASMTTGARVNTIRSAPTAMMSSFVMSLIASAIGWSTPNGPARFGPSRPWKRPSNRRSTHVYIAPIAMTVFVTRRMIAIPAAAYATHDHSSPSRSCTNS